VLADDDRIFVNTKSKVCEQIVDQIRVAIFSGRLKPGDKLPNEKELLEELHVSRGTLREARRSLEGLGLLEVRQGVAGGSYVTEIALEKARDSIIGFFHFKRLSLQNLVEVRLMLEPEIAAKVALLITPDDLKKLHDLNRNCARVIKGEISSSLRQDFLEFHRIIASVMGNPILTFLLDVIKNLPIENLPVSHQPTEKISANVLRAHNRIYQALKNRDPQSARQEVQKHIVDLQASFEARSKKSRPKDKQVRKPE
jgi:GntR family transcriptional repressor for pyruvate dehydrogenase complex